MPSRLERILLFLPWPLPALLAWAVGWGAAIACRESAGATGWELAAGTAAATAVAMANTGLRRRAIAALGFPLSALAMLGGSGGLAAWVWLAVLVPLALIFPPRTWRDAPFFPTPAAALDGLDGVVRPPPRRLLDAGCGLGHGLAALRRLWPQAELKGVEWSAPMAWLAARRVPGARVHRADMWACSWAGFDLVYLFQRPETMARAWNKASAEMAAGSWLVSLEFPVPGVGPTVRFDAGRGRGLYVYRVPGLARAPRPKRSTGAAPGR